MSTSRATRSTPNKNVWEEISGGSDVFRFGKHEIGTRAYVGAFNFKGQDQQKKVGQLSGGERNRVHMAKMLKEGGNVLLLDEPTNDLDVETLRALEEALENFAGCAVVISHDRFFLDRLATHILAFEGDSHVEWFEGNFEAYEEDKRRRLGPEADRPHRMTYREADAVSPAPVFHMTGRDTSVTTCYRLHMARPQSKSRTNSPSVTATAASVEDEQPIVSLAQAWKSGQHCRLEFQAEAWRGHYRAAGVAGDDLYRHQGEPHPVAAKRNGGKPVRHLAEAGPGTEPGGAPAGVHFVRPICRLRDGAAAPNAQPLFDLYGLLVQDDAKFRMLYTSVPSITEAQLEAHREPPREL